MNNNAPPPKCDICTSHIDGIARSTLLCGHTFHPRCLHLYYFTFASCPVPTCATVAGWDTMPDTVQETPINTTQKQWYQFSPSVTAMVAAAESPNKIRLAGFTKHDIIAKKIPIGSILQSYTIATVADFGITWKDMITLGLTKDHLKLISDPSILADPMGANITDIVRLGLDIHGLGQLRYSLDDLIKLRCNGKFLIAMGLTRETMCIFPNLNPRDFVTLYNQ